MSVRLMQGFLPLREVVDTGGMDIDLDVDLEKTIDSHDWRMIFALFDAPSDASLEEFVEIYRSNPDKTLLDRMFPFLGKRRSTISCRVTVHISGGENLTLRLGVRVLRLQQRGQTKDVALLNTANFVALTPDGSPYDGMVAHCSEP
ncbi:hypothetical protein [Streptomyces lanatus]|uniref:Uncharacterized protein n=1 Tax=Streptomyces lanatus TaxID=66900 RepID=A0ABV1XQH3_9ACTN|nr:hypothetical protein [Streptomyces lanatus]GHG89065.1 hypothetical protein GCM10018780_07990 [Streptomyces lanatus]